MRINVSKDSGGGAVVVGPNYFELNGCKECGEMTKPLDTPARKIKLNIKTADVMVDFRAVFNGDEIEIIIDAYPDNWEF